MLSAGFDTGVFFGFSWLRLSQPSFANLMMCTPPKHSKNITIKEMNPKGKADSSKLSIRKIAFFIRTVYNVCLVTNWRKLE